MCVCMCECVDLRSQFANKYKTIQLTGILWGKRKSQKERKKNETKEL